MFYKDYFQICVWDIFWIRQDVLARCLACLNKTSLRHLIDFFFARWPFPAYNYLLKIGNGNTKTRCENYLSLRKKILKRRQRRCSRVFIVTCEHISLFVVIAGFERANVCWGHIEKAILLTTRSCISCVILQYFKHKRNLLIIWAYTNTTLRVN